MPGQQETVLMVTCSSPQAIRRIRRYLDDIAYGPTLRLCVGDAILPFPPFTRVNRGLSGLSREYHFIYALLLLGHRVEDRHLTALVPGEVVRDLADVGLLTRDERGRWRTPGLAVNVCGGLYVVCGLPPFYPTGDSRGEETYLGTDSAFFAETLAPCYRGLSVLDICAGSGVQGLVCAMRDAARVVFLERNRIALEASRFNALLNGLESRCEMRESDGVAALGESDLFDRIVCNPPFMPISDDLGLPEWGSGGPDGLRVIRKLLPGIVQHLGDQGQAFVLCSALGDQYAIYMNRELLEPLARNHGLWIRAYIVAKTPFREYITVDLEGSARFTCRQLTGDERRERIGAWREDLIRSGMDPQYVYGQMISIRRATQKGSLEEIPYYTPAKSDPLVSKYLDSPRVAV
jgi:methylase of polypeptide subunit release factors